MPLLVPRDTVATSRPPPLVLCSLCAAQVMTAVRNLVQPAGVRAEILSTRPALLHTIGGIAMSPHDSGEIVHYALSTLRVLTDGVASDADLVDSLTPYFIDDAIPAAGDVMLALMQVTARWSAGLLFVMTVSCPKYLVFFLFTFSCREQRQSIWLTVRRWRTCSPFSIPSPPLLSFSSTAPR